MWDGNQLCINNVWRSLLLWREIPMAWGTTTDSLTPKINSFQYAIEIKYLTLKDHSDIVDFTTLGESL